MTKPSQPLIHRACDACRIRKVLCTGEPTGCERCVRRSESCHYSNITKPQRRAPPKDAHMSKDTRPVINPAKTRLDQRGYSDLLGLEAQEVTPAPTMGCTCHPSLLSALTALRSTSTNSSTLAANISIIRTTQSSLAATLRCPTRETFVCTMLLGTVLPLVLLLFESTLAMQTPVEDDERKVDVGGVNVVVGKEVWDSMKKGAVEKEWGVMRRFLEDMRGWGGSQDGEFCRKLREMVAEMANRVGAAVEGLGRKPLDGADSVH